MAVKLAVEVGTAPGIADELYGNALISAKVATPFRPTGDAAGVGDGKPATFMSRRPPSS